MRNDVCITMTVMSLDPDCSPEIAGMIGASLVTAVSDIPWNGPIGGVQVGLVDGEIVLNPTQEQRKKSDLALTVAATMDKIVMIEAGANEVDEDTMLNAIKAAHVEIKKIITFINGIVAERGKPKIDFQVVGLDMDVFHAIKEKYLDDFKAAMDTDDKNVRDAALLPIMDKIAEEYPDLTEADLDLVSYKMQKYDLKSDLLPEEVFAFTPKGDVINLPTGATCIDFAYAIHSAVGNRMVGCKVNNRMVPIDHIVSTGEIIEVILGPADKGPSRDWLKIVRTSEAKSKIRNWFKKMRREENIQQGRDALARELRREMIIIPDDQLDEFINSCCRRLRQNNAEELYAAIGYGGMTIANCLPKLKEEWTKLKAAEQKPEEDLPKVDLSKVHATDGVVVEGFDNTPIKFAKCCSPLPGDPIVGFITRGFGVSIHKQSCANAISSMKDPTNAPRWVKAYWADSVKDSYKAGLEIIALNRNELLQDVLAALADIRVPIYALNARQVENNCAVVSLTIGINNTEHLNRVVARLSKVKDVLKVTRS